MTPDLPSATARREFERLFEPRTDVRAIALKLAHYILDRGEPLPVEVAAAIYQLEKAH